MSVVFGGEKPGQKWDRLPAETGWADGAINKDPARPETTPWYSGVFLMPQLNANTIRQVKWKKKGKKIELPGWQRIQANVEGWPRDRWRTFGRTAAFPISSTFFLPPFLLRLGKYFWCWQQKHWRATAWGKYIDKRHAPATKNTSCLQSNSVGKKIKKEKKCSVARGPWVRANKKNWPLTHPHTRGATNEIFA